MLVRGVALEQLAIVWLLPAVAAVVLLAASRRSRKSIRDQVWMVVALVSFVYLVAAVAITLWPFQVDLSPEKLLDRENWIPLRGTLGFVLSDNPMRVRVGLRDLLANVVLFFPLGLLLGSLTRRWIGSALVFVVLGSLALGLELVQGVSVAGRTLDIDDAISGALGATTGLAAALVLRPLVRPG